MSHKPILDPDHPEYSNDDPTWGEEPPPLVQAKHGYIISVRTVREKPDTVIVDVRCPWCGTREEIMLETWLLDLVWKRGRLCDGCFLAQEKVR